MTTKDDHEPPVDPRRALGRRPGAQPPRLHIDDSAFDLVPPSPTFNPPSSPRTRHVSLSIPPTSPDPSASPTSPSTSPNTRKFRQPTINRSKPAKVSSRGLYETQKLLSHLLDRLEAREQAPDLLTRAAISARQVSGQAKGRQKGKAAIKIGQTLAAAAHTGLSVAQGSSSAPRSAQGISSDDVEEQYALDEGDWDTEITYDLVEQTRGLLVLASKQGLDLFISDSEVRGTSPHVRPTKRKTGRFTSFASPVSPVKPVFDEDDTPPTSAASSISGRNLLDRLVSVLDSLIRVDCLHRTHHFRLSRPPNGLQAACLDIATYLYHACRSEINVHMVESVIGGLETMGAGMGDRICEWLEGRLGELLGRLASERGGPEQRTFNNTAEIWKDPFAKQVPQSDSLPTFALSTDTPDSKIPSNSPGWVRYSPRSPVNPFFSSDRLPGILSLQASTVEARPLTLQLASLIPRLLLVMASAFDLSSAKLTTIHRIHRLLSLVLTAKPDASLDLLEIVAHAPSRSRRAAVSILSTFYPGLIGHNSIAKRPALSTYSAQRTKWETGQDKAFREDSAEDHHFVPWRVSSRDGGVDASGQCSTCQTDIHGFCLKCTLCKQFRHLHCYSNSVPDQGFHYEVIAISSRDSAPYVVYVKFSLCLERLEEKILYGDTAHGDASSTRRRIGQHDLHLVNLFTMTLCDECRLPLWGTSSQAYACLNGCQRFYHPMCTARLATRGRGACNHGQNILVDEVSAQGRNPFEISLDTLLSSFESDAGYLCLDTDAIHQRPYDEVAVLYGALWTQYQLLKNGLTSGSIRPIHPDGRDIDSDVLALRPYLKAYDEYLRLGDTAASSAATDFAHVANGGQILSQGYLFSDRYLAYVTALLRSPASSVVPQSPAVSDSYLTPAVALPSPELPLDNDNPGSYESLSLATLAQSLDQDMNIHDPQLAAIFLNQLNTTGMIWIPGQSHIEAEDIATNAKWASFGLPFLMDSSPTAELLILAVEKLLDDLDLSMNEIGLGLLASRAWPSLLCAPYALERLGAALVRWIVVQDETLHAVVKQYASKHEKLPGVRNGSKGNSSVQTYKEERLALQIRYAHPWLSALHDQDPVLYAHIVYEQCKSTEGLPLTDDTDSDEAASRIAARALDRMTTMLDAGVLFSAHLDLLTAWLEDLGALASKDMIYRSLPRLLKHSPPHRNEAGGTEDIWSLSRYTILEGSEGVARVCKWFRVLAFSGAEVPWPLLVSIVDAYTAGSMIMSPESTLDLMIAVNANAAQIEASEFATLCCSMFVNLVTVSSNPFKDRSDVALDLLRQNMLVILRAYGVTAEDIASTKLASIERNIKQPASLSKKRRPTTSLVLMTMDDRLVPALVLLLRGKNYPTELVLDFMWLLFTRSTSTANIDGFIHKQSAELYPVMWDLVDDLVDRQCRARVFLRLLAVNPAPMERIVKEEFRAGDRTRLRERLLRFVLELADDSLTYENISWRRASVGLVILSFEALVDHMNVSPDSLVIVKSMLPTQLTAISGCFEEYLIQSSDENRLVLMSRLHRLRILLPSWPVLSWRVLEDLLIETNSSISQLAPARTSSTIPAMLDPVKVRADLVALGLDMLSAGIEIPWITAQRFQQHVGQACSLPWLHPVESLTSLVLPALRSVLDSTCHIVIGTQVADGRTKKTALIGALFVPVVIEFGRQLVAQDYLTQRTILDILHVVFFKQSTRTVELAALGSLQSIAEFVKDGECTENRLLGLQILQTAVNRVEKDSLVRAAPIIFATMAKVLVKETDKEGDAAIIEQTRIYLRTLIKTFGRSRLFVQLFKNDSTGSMDASGKLVLSKALQMLRAQERAFSDGIIGISIVDLAIADLPDILKRGRQVVEQVLESFERFSSTIEGEISEEAATSFGMFLTRLGKHVAEWDTHEFDPNAILCSSASVLSLSPSSSAVLLLHQISTLLHLCLTRFAVKPETMSRLLTALEIVVKLQSSEDTVRTVLFELAGSAMHGLAVPLTTLDTLIRFINLHAYPLQTTVDSASISTHERRVLSDSAGGCMSILLRTHPSLIGARGEPELTLSTTSQAATLLVRCEMAAPGSLPHHLGSIIGEAAIVQLRVFSAILLASLDIPMVQARNRLLALYPILARAVSLCLRAGADLLSVQDVAGEGVDNLSTVFVVMRLALLASSDLSSEVEVGGSKGVMEEAIESLWARVWPDWYRLLSLSAEATCVNGPLRSTAHTVFLDTLIFLGSANSTILVNHAGALAHALRILHRNQGTTIHGGTKMLKAEIAFKEAGLDNAKVDIAGMIRTIKGDLLAAERLKALRSVRP